jgi:hypothetical protein
MPVGCIVALKKVVVAMLLLSSVLLLSPGPGPVKVHGTTNPLSTLLIANVGGWNSTIKGAIINPTLTEFRNVTFSVTIKWDDTRLYTTHQLAIYPPGYNSANVYPGNPDALNRSGAVGFYTTTTILSARFLLPRDDFKGPAGFEYFCEYHPMAVKGLTAGMHGKLQIFKNPDIDGNGKVDILDASALAFSFDTTPASLRWNVAADLNNDGIVDIGDAALVAFYFDQKI